MQETHCSSLPDDKTWMARAIAVTSNSEIDVPVGCVIVHEGKEIAAARNCREQENDPAGHAEILALRLAATSLRNWRLSNCIIYITLEPCAMCAEAIIQSRAKRVIFGAYDPVAGAAGSRFNLFADRQAVAVPEVIGGICEIECRKLLTDFFVGRRKE